MAEADRRPAGRKITGRPARAPFELGGNSVAAGESATIDVPISRLSTHTEISLPVRVLHGKRPGPVLFVSAAIHGDEIIGVEIIRRLLNLVSVDRLAGTLICVPVVNLFGFISHQRYLPDRRDLNRVFPGTPNGSLAAQLAHVFNQEIVQRSDFGIDLHSAALHRTNLPQIRISDERPRAMEMAQIFGAPAVVVSRFREGSLRHAAADSDVDVLVYESGEALRFDELAIRLGVKGIFRVMSELGMGVRRQGKVPARPIFSSSTKWVRAPEGGIFRAVKTTGELVEEGDILGYLSDPFGDTDLPVLASVKGIIIGRSNLPVVNQGDALMHVAVVQVPGTAEDRMNQINEAVLCDPLFDEDEVI